VREDSNNLWKKNIFKFLIQLRVNLSEKKIVKRGFQLYIFQKKNFSHSFNLLAAKGILVCLSWA